ncbi:MAG: CpsD/CapB family tyrosine-protein kinase [Acidobacteriia bacterium]|nr:CpsD/CapB family tyrosine-protein kinase [Terriglobia bacterium]
MSEILKGLKEARKEGRDAAPLGLNGPAELNPRRMELRTPNTAEIRGENHFTPAQKPLNTDPVFNLDTADHRVKTILDPHTIVGEQYRLLRTKLSAMQKEKGLKTLLISSTVPNEGKTLVSCGLSVILAQEPGKRVLLIDADLRKPDVSRTLGLTEEDRFDGLSRVLSGEVSLEEAVLPCSEEELYFLPAGPVPRNPAELLSSRHLELALKTAARLFNWVIIDSPPVLPLTDTSILVPHCDAALLVVHANSTPAKLIQGAIEAIGREKLCGIVLNRVRHIRTSTYYYYHHHQMRRKK